MKNIFIIKEGTLESEIKTAIREGRKVIKLGKKAETPAVPLQQEMPIPQEEPAGQPLDNMPLPTDDNEQNQYDTNFDAGVEADEESDPKRYIQQLTGKLSQSLNSYNETQPDTGLCKYVASMIITATCKNLDEKVKKELADKVMTVTGSEEESEPIEEPETNAEESAPGEIQEGHIITKRELREMAENVIPKNKELKNVPKAWIGKK